MLGKEIYWLLKKEIAIEWRRRFAFHGILLYLVSTIFVAYMAFAGQSKHLNVPSWNALFWIVLLFTAVSVVTKSFAQEAEGRQLYYYTLARAESIIISKIIYNSGLMCLMALVGYGIYSILLNNPVENHGLFFLNLLLGSLCFASSLTLVSGIAAKAGNNATLMAVLSFPIVLPLLLLLIKVSKNAIDGLAWSVSFDELLTLFAINLIVLSISYVLFPYLWRT